MIRLGFWEDHFDNRVKGRVKRAETGGRETR